MLQADAGWHKRRLAITLPILLMFALTTTSFFYEAQSSNQRIKLEFEQQAVELKTALETSITNNLNVLRFISDLYASSTVVNRQEFRTFVTQSLASFQGIQALSWNPIIHASERAGFEKNAQLEGYPNFQITERDADKKMGRAGDRPAFVSVLFIEPYNGNESALGYDVYSNNLRHEAIDRARDSGELALTAGITLVQERGKQQGVMSFMPIYQNGHPHQTQKEKRQAISGYAVGVFRVGDVVTHALNGLNIEGLSYRLIDQSAPAAEQLLFSSASPTLSPLELPSNRFFGEKISLISYSSFQVGGRFWRFEVVPTQNYFALHQSNNSWLILLGGLVLTSLVAAFSLISSGRERMLRQLVAERTAELERQHVITYSILQEKEQAHARLDLLLNSTGEGIYGIGLDGACTFANHAALTMLGYASQQDVLGKNNHLLFHHSHPDGSSYEINECPIYKALRGQPSLAVDSEVLWRKDGSSFSAQYQSYPIKDSEQIIGCVVSFSDITEHKKAQETLTMLSMALEQSQSSVMITDLDTHIEYVNQAFVKSTGYSREEVFGQKPSMLSSKKTSQDTYQAMWAALNIGKAWQGEVTNLNKQGEEFIELTWISPIRQDDGAITHYLGVKEDITERKQLELSLLEAKEKAEILAHTKSQFLTNMSHEIRTPMNAIIGLSQLALNKDFAPEALDYLRKINRSSVSLLGILNSILDLSKLEAGGMTLDQQPFYLDALRNTLDSLFILAAQEKNLAFNLDVAADIPPLLIGDALRLRQVLINLLGNAIKFTQHGAVTLNITLQQSDASKVRLLFCVKDTGIGISAEDQTKLFQPFTQVDASSTRRFGGTGLGLVISKDLLTLMGSELSLDSSPGQGSAFSFELVLGVVASTTLQNTAPYESETLNSALNKVGSILGGLRILAVEDNVFNQQIVIELLKLSGIRVEIANNGEEALVMLAQQNFDAVLMDIHMPVMDGFEATKQIRSQSRFDKLPVIALTAGVTQEERGQCMAAGMNDFINKPVNPSQLLSTLVQWLKPNQVVDAAVEDIEPPLEVEQWLDVNVLREVLGDNPATIAKFLGFFQVTAVEISAEIIATIKAGELDAAGAAAHKLSSSARSVGALKLGDLCKQLEIAGKSGDQATLTTLLPQFEREWSMVEKHLISWPGKP
jgi:PAS domain S-box-containing protein